MYLEPTKLEKLLSKQTKEKIFNDSLEFQDLQIVEYLLCKFSEELTEEEIRKLYEGFGKNKGIDKKLMTIPWKLPKDILEELVDYPFNWINGIASSARFQLYLMELDE